MSTKKKEEKNYNSSELILVSIGSTILLGLIIFVIIYGLFIYKTDSKTKKWNIFFSRIVNYSCTDNTICTTPTVYTNSTSTGIFSVEFKNSDQSAVYEVTVKNDGILDAELTSVILSTPNCIGNADNEESANNDAETVCNNLSYKLTDIDGNTITLGDTLHKGESKKYYLRVSYSNDYHYVGINDQLSGSVTINNLSLVLNYAQVE